ncbi:MAG: hypothetical protein ACKO86_07385 [Dolichospermum sp.]
MLGEWTFQLSGELCLHGACEKYILKRAVENWLPKGKSKAFTVGVKAFLILLGLASTFTKGILRNSATCSA